MFTFSLILLAVVCVVFVYMVFLYKKYNARQQFILDEKQKMLSEIEALEFIPEPQKQLYRQIMSVSGKLLSAKQSERVVIDTIKQFRFDDEKILTIADVKQYLKKDTVTFDELAQTPAGQCLLGAGERMTKTILPSVPYPESMKRELLDSCGSIYYNVAAIVSVAILFRSNHKTALQKMALFYMGHERRHAAQSQRYLLQGRLSQLSHIAHNGGLMNAVINGYCLLASEEDADRAGYQFMMQNFKK